MNMAQDQPPVRQSFENYCGLDTSWCTKVQHVKCYLWFTALFHPGKSTFSPKSFSSELIKLSITDIISKFSGNLINFGH